MTANLSISTARPAAPASRPALLLLDAGLMLGLFVVAVAVRWPGLLTVPRFTDEQLDVLYTIPLYRLQGLPIVGFDPYNGPIFSYLMAATLWLVGPQPGAPRLLSLLVGAATVAATYLLGRKLCGGRVGGLVAAGLLLTCVPHVVINSHMAWSNATTPFFTTLAFLVILPAVTHGSGPRLALGALAFAIALQTHPSVIAFLPGVGLAVLLRRPGLVRSRWTIAAGALFLVGYGNMLGYHLFVGEKDPYWELARSQVPGWRMTDDDMIGRLSHEERMNAEGESGLAAYPGNLGRVALNLPRLAAGLVEPRPIPTDFLREASFWLYGLLVLVGLAWPLRHGNPLPLVGGLSFLLLLPLFNSKYEPIFNGRYLMPVLPLAFAGFGSLVGDLWRAFGGLTMRRSLRLGLAAGGTLLVLYPLLPLTRYHQRAAPDGQINHDLIQTASAIQVNQAPGEPILLDEALGRRGLAGDGDILMSLRAFLELRGVSYRVGPATPGRIDGELGGARTALVAFAQPYDRALDSRFRFTQIEEKTSGRYALFRIERR